MAHHLLASIINSVPSSVFALDRQHRFIFANDAYASGWLGKSVPEIMGRRPEDFYTAEQAGYFRVANESVMNSGKELQIENEVMGRVIWSIKFPLREFPQGPVVGLCAILTDITEGQRLEKSLHQARHKILDTAPAAISFVKNRRVQWCNPVHDRLLGYEAGECIGLDTAVFYATSQECERVGTEAYTQIAQGEVYSTEVELKRKDGSRFWASLIGRQADIGNGADGSIWIFYDASEQQVTREIIRETLCYQAGELLALEKRFAWLFHNIPLPAALTRLEDGLLMEANESFFRLTGFQREEAIGRTVLELQLYAEPEQRRFIKAKLHHHGHLHHHEFSLRTQSGQIRSLLLWADWVSIGNELRILSVFLDITEQKQLEQQRQQLQERLQQAQKLDALGVLAGGIAHDFNNILGAIISFAEVAKKDNPDNLELQANLGEILKASNRATDLIRQILSFSRQQKPERQPVPIAPIIKEALKLLQATLPNDISIQETIPRHLPEVLADPTQILRLIMNLCTNAAQSMAGQPGKIDIRLESLKHSAAPTDSELTSSEYLKLTVSDTGRGMNEATLKRIFEPFFTTKEPGKGTGLGLSVVHGIVKEHDGVITVESALERGTTVAICLPALSPAKNLASATRLEIPPGQSEPSH